jgi:purine-binding chemotaxis protein CheW
MKDYGKRALPAGKAADKGIQLAVFRVGEQEYALDIMVIREIINPLPITRVPKAPAFVEGVIELRGQILPIVDMRKRFDAPASPPTRASKYVIVSLGEQAVGLIVDGVSEVVRRSGDDVRPAPALAVGDTRFFRGMLRHDDRIFVVLDIDQILSSQEKISLAGLATA